MPRKAPQRLALKFDVAVVAWAPQKDPNCAYAGERIVMNPATAAALLNGAFPACTETSSTVTFSRSTTPLVPAVLDEPPREAVDEPVAHTQCQAHFDLRTQGGGFRLLTRDGVVIGCVTHQGTGAEERWQFDIRRMIQF
jgi:hypothetical protein